MTKAQLITKIPPGEPIYDPYPETRIQAGFPSPAQDYETTSIDLNDILIQDSHLYPARHRLVHD